MTGATFASTGLAGGALVDIGAVTAADLVKADREFDAVATGGLAIAGLALAGVTRLWPTASDTCDCPVPALEGSDGAVVNDEALDSGA